MSADDTTDHGREVPGREEVDGRGEGQGWWLESKAEEAFRRWGFRTARNGRIWGHEVDVIAANSKGARYLAECKDYDSTRITPRDIWRLVALAYSIGARPVLVHASALSPGAAEICRYWRVTRITVGDVLHCEEMPRPSRPRREFGDDIRRGNWNPKWRDEEFRDTIIGRYRDFKRIERKPEYRPRG